MSDTDSNQGQAEYSDDSDYENAGQSFISGRQSKNIDESIAQQTVQFNDVPKVGKQYKASVYTKKKKQVEKEEEPQVSPYRNQPNNTVSNQHEVIQKSEPSPTNNKQIFQSVTASKILQEQAQINERQAHEHQIIVDKQIPIDEIINDEEDGEAVYSDDEASDPQLGRESYMSTSPHNIQFTRQQNTQPQEKGRMYKKNQLRAQQEYETQIFKEQSNEPRQIKPQEHIVHQENNQHIQQEGKLQDDVRPHLVTAQQTATFEETKSQQPLKDSSRQPQSIQQASKNDKPVLLSVSQPQPDIQKVEENFEEKLQEANQENHKENQQEKYQQMDQQKHELSSMDQNFKPVQHIVEQNKQQSPVVQLQQSKEQLLENEQIKEEMPVQKAHQQITLKSEQNRIAQLQQQVNQLKQQRQQASNNIVSAAPQSNENTLQEIKRQQQRQEKQQAIDTLDSARSVQPNNQYIPKSEEIKEQMIILPQIKVENAQAERETQKTQQLNSNPINQQKEVQFAQKPNQLNLLANLKVVPTNQSQYSEDEVQRKLFPSSLQKKSQDSVIMISRKAEKQYIPIESSNQSYAQLSNDTPPRLGTINNPQRTMTKLSSQIKEQPKGGESQACKCEIM